jgi:CRP-like cAMP-binding protein
VAASQLAESLAHADGERRSPNRFDGHHRGRWPGTAERPGGIALLDADLDFQSGVPDDGLDEARRIVVVPRVDVDPGAWEPPAQPAWPRPVTGVVIIEGILARDVRLGPRVATQILGPGDVCDPWGAQDENLPCDVRWRVYERVVLAGLDARFTIAARRWPSLGVVVQRKLCQRADRLAAQSAALQLPRVDDRVLAILWQLAERFGRVRTDHVVMPFRLSHQMIGQLVGARRPTVSLALKDLADAGIVRRGPGDSWLLASSSRERLAPDADARAAR